MDEDGRYCTRSAYNVISGAEVVGECEADSRVFRWIWNCISPIKVTATVYWATWNRLPTRENLCRRNIIEANGDFNCPICNLKPETVAQLFLECHGTSSILWY